MFSKCNECNECNVIMWYLRVQCYIGIDIDIDIGVSASYCNVY